MNEITPEESEEIIAAASRGAIVPGHEPVGEMLTELHGPAGADAALHSPFLVTPASRATGRFARRTAIVASAAVLSLSGVAAAATAGIEILDPLVGDGSPEVAEAVIEEAEGETEEAPGAADSADAPAVEVADEATESDAGEEDGGEEPEADTGDDKGPDHLEDRVEGVVLDDDDGLSDDEIELLCAAAERHGEFVSAVARNKSVEPDVRHGQRVSAAAQRDDCGKPDKDLTEGAESEGEESEDLEGGEEAEGEESEDPEGGEAEGEDEGEGAEDEGAENGQGHGRDGAPGQNKDKSNNGQGQGQSNR